MRGSLGTYIQSTPSLDHLKFEGVRGGVLGGRGGRRRRVCMFWWFETCLIRELDERLRANEESRDKISTASVQQSLHNADLTLPNSPESGALRPSGQAFRNNVSTINSSELTHCLTLWCMPLSLAEVSIRAPQHQSNQLRAPSASRDWL